MYSWPLPSGHYYWKSSYNEKSAAPLHRKVITEDWSVERFCLGPELKDLYSQFLFGFPLDNFSFIGITEFFDKDYAYFMEHPAGGTEGGI